MDEGSAPRPAHQPSHDGFVRTLFAYHEVAIAQLQWLLPARLVQQLDWSTLRHGPTDTANVTGRALRSDVVFEVSTIAGEPLLLHVLLEHQRRDEPVMAFRIVEYQTRIWRHVLDGADGVVTRLPPIVAVVLYNGTSPWRAATAIERLAPAPTEWALGPLHLRGAFLLLDLSVVPDEEIQRRAVHAHLRLGLLVMKHISAADFWTRFVDWAAVLLEVLAMTSGRDRIDAVLHYLFRAAAPPTDDERRRVIQLLPTFEGNIMTWAEEVKQQALQEGLQKGLQEGRRETLLEVLEARFGPLPATVALRVGRADADQLSTWIRRVVDSTLSLDEVLDETPR